MAIYADRESDDFPGVCDMVFNGEYVVGGEEYDETRLKIIEMSGYGSTVPEVAEKVGMHPINVRKWIHRFNERGLAGLVVKRSPGRPPGFSEDFRARVRALKSNIPGAEHWRLQDFQNYILEHQWAETISLETVRQMLQCCDCSEG